MTDFISAIIGDVSLHFISQLYHTFPLMLNGIDDGKHFYFSMCGLVESFISMENVVEGFRVFWSEFPFGLLQGEQFRSWFSAMLSHWKRWLCVDGWIDSWYIFVCCAWTMKFFLNFHLLRLILCFFFRLFRLLVRFSHLFCFVLLLPDQFFPLLLSWFMHFLSLLYHFLQLLTSFSFREGKYFAKAS